MRNKDAREVSISIINVPNEAGLSRQGVTYSDYDSCDHQNMESVYTSFFIANILMMKAYDKSAQPLFTL